ncbi:complex I NDUFA9 subunit family protein [Luteithermobacter gelatinilyticus]|uniref:complex I NDUFA9 subunit family protein n=1 Tax=Luteithermobacter gelatinilyticus TaxID=2582913 RepID=UPI00143DA229|nr:complex I NDUFA9 subunit family protein [Luteithermobacter gelatinilyticus]
MAMEKDARLVTIFGGSGFVGRTLVQHLAKAGYRVRVAVRHPNSALFLKPLGEVGQIQVCQANIRHEESVRAAVQGSYAVVNLVGILYESGRQKFNTVQALGAGLIAKNAAASGVRKLVHISAIGADAESPSAYAKSKAKGEEAVRHYFPSATIFRPSIIFGADDSFFNRFGALAKCLPFMPVICGDTKFQPVYVGDVADAILKVIDTPGFEGRTFELGGPRVYSFRELLKLILKETRNDIPMIEIPLPLARLQAFFLGLLPKPMLTLDQLRQLEKDNVVREGADGLRELGLTPTPVESVIPSYMIHYRPKGQFEVEA